MTPEIEMYQTVNLPMSWLDKTILFIALVIAVGIPAEALYSFTPTDWHFLAYKLQKMLIFLTGDLFFPLTWVKAGQAFAAILMGEILYICWCNRRSLRNPQ